MLYHDARIKKLKVGVKPYMEDEIKVAIWDMKISIDMFES